jgi:hypothetical protein
VAVQSIRAAVEIGNVAGDHLLVAAREMPFGEVHGVGKLDHLAQEVRARSKALDDARHLLASGAGAPEVIGGGRVARGFMVFEYPDLGRLFPGASRVRAARFPIVFHKPNRTQGSTPTTEFAAYLASPRSSIFSITKAREPPRSKTLPLAVTFWPAKGKSFSF